MATQVSISGTPQWAKIRSPVGVYALNVVTFGIYGWCWWYFINRELRDLGRANGSTSELGDNPGLSTAAFSIGIYAFFIPFVWTIVTTMKRIQAGQRLVGAEEMSGWIAGLLWVFTLGIGGVIYTQSQMNSIWRTQPVAMGLAAQHPAPTANADLERLKQLSELRDGGAITDQEFETEKARLMPQLPSAAGESPPSSGGI